MINLTPHEVTIRVGDEDIVLPPSGTVARVETVDEAVEPVEVDGTPVPTVRRTFGQVTGLPDVEEPVLVSAIVLAAVPGRPGTYAPDTGPTAVRDPEGRVVAVTRLVAA